MDVLEYVKVQKQLIRIGKEIRDMNLSEFINGVSRAEAVGPIIDPTMYMRAMDNLSNIRDLASAAQDFKSNTAHVDFEKLPSEE